MLFHVPTTKTVRALRVGDRAPTYDGWGKVTKIIGRDRFMSGYEFVTYRAVEESSGLSSGPIILIANRMLNSSNMLKHFSFDTLDAIERVFNFGGGEIYATSLLERIGCRRFLTWDRRRPFQGEKTP